MVYNINMAELPIFNIEYQRAYTSSIEFKTQINEKQKGREQRYPQWTYPKRTFTLKFDKNFAGRQELENFFIEVMGQGNYVDVVVLDTYDFNKNDPNPLVKMGRRAQETGKLNPYFTIVKCRYKLK